MATAAYYNLGNSDIYFYDTNGNEYSRIYNIRKITKDIFQNIELDNCVLNKAKTGFILNKEIELQLKTSRKDVVVANINRIEFPIISSFFKYLSMNGKKPTKIFFFYTDQPGENNRQDTIYIYEIVKKFLMQAFRYSFSAIIGERITLNPADYDEMTKFYNDFFDRNKEIKYFEDNYLQLTTGTPQMVNVLAIKLIDYPHSYYYMARNVATSKTDKVVKLEYFDRINYYKYKNLIENIIEGLNYELAKEVYDISPFKRFRDISELFSMANCLKNFNFIEAYDIIQKVNIDLQLRGVLSDILCFPEKKLSIIYYLMEVYLKNGEYLETVALLFGLMENIRISIFKKVFNVNIEKIDGEFKEFNEFIEENEDLKQYLISKKKKYFNNPSRIVVQTIFEYFNERENDIIEKFILNEYLKLNRIIEDNKLQDLRNMLPFAHGTEGVKADSLEKIREIMNMFKGILGQLNIIDEKSKNVFLEINETVISLIKEKFNI